MICQRRMCDAKRVQNLPEAFALVTNPYCANGLSIAEMIDSRQPSNDQDATFFEIPHVAQFTNGLVICWVITAILAAQSLLCAAPLTFQRAQPCAQ
jgi:hypothetical protein